MDILNLATLGIGLVNSVVLVILFKSVEEKHKESHLSDEIILRNARRRSNVILGKAIERADSIVAAAHKQGVEVVSREKNQGEKLESQYQADLAAVADELTKALEQSEKSAEASYRKFLDDLGHEIERQIKDSQGVLQEQAAAAMKKTEESIQQFVSDIHQEMKNQIGQEVGAAKDAVAEYKRSRMEVVDRELVAIIEQTVQATLAKTLNVSDHTELAYQALEEAKRDHFFAS